MLITIQQFTLPCDNLADGAYTLRTWYPQGFLDSSGQSVAPGTATTGLQLRSDVNVSGGFMTFDPYTVYSTLDAQVPQPQSLQIQCQVFKGNTALPVNPFNQSGTPSSWIVPDDLGATISFEEWTIANQAIQLYYYQPNWYTQAQVDALIAANNVQVAFNQDYAIGQYASFAAAVAAAAVTDGTLVINEATTTGTQTVPANVTLRFTRKGSLTVTTGQTVHILGPVEADPVQIFFNANSGQGTVSFANNTAIFGVVPNWWFTNATPGTTDVTSGFNAAIATGQTVLIPEGTYGVTNLLMTADYQQMVGAGRNISLLQSLSSGKVVNIAASRCALTGFSINGHLLADYGVYLDAQAHFCKVDIEIYNVTGTPGTGIANQGTQNYGTLISSEINSCKRGVHLIPAAQESSLVGSVIFDNSEYNVRLGNGLSPLYSIGISNSDIENCGSVSVAGTNIIVDWVVPLSIGPQVYFESSRHVDACDVRVISAGSVIGIDGVLAAGNNIANDSIVLDAAVNMKISNYTENAYINAVPITDLDQADRVVQLENVDFDGTKIPFRIYNGSMYLQNGASAPQFITEGTSGGVGVAHEFRMQPSSGKYNWVTGAQFNVDNGFEITPSTVVDGDVFTTPVFKVTRAGNATITGTTSSGSLALVNQVSAYNNTATAAGGIAAIFASVASTGQTASIGSTNLQVGGAVASAGLYRVHIYTVVTSTGTGTLTSTLGWSDPAAARTITSAGIATTATNYEQVSYDIRVNGIANITYATTLSVSGTYSIYVTLERLQ